MDPHARWMVGVEARISALLGLQDEEISEIIRSPMPFCFPCLASTVAPSSDAAAVPVPSRDSCVSSNIKIVRAALRLGGIGLGVRVFTSSTAFIGRVEERSIRTRSIEILVRFGT
jgi:hypothetical protein